jgi:hypothetical protein
MKLMDQQGRIFGKINLIDFIVIILFALLVVFAASKILDKDVGGGSIPLKYTVLVEEGAPVTYESVLEHVPSQLMASGSLVDGYVTGVEATTHIIYTEAAGGELVAAEDPQLLDLVFTIEVNVPKDSVQLNTVGTQEVRIGKVDHYVKTQYFEFVGTILTAQWAQ